MTTRAVTSAPVDYTKDIIVLSDGRPISLRAVGFGTALGDYRGCTSYSNGYSHDLNGPKGTWGYQWQCVEYVNRFFATVLGHYNMVGTGNADNYYGTAGARGLEAHPNGGGTPPREGDILCSNAGDYGHVAIVRAVYASSVHVIQQNWFNDGRDADYALSRSGNTVSGFSGSYSIVGWLHKPGTGGGGDGVSNFVPESAGASGPGQPGFWKYGTSSYWKDGAVGDGGHMYYVLNNDEAHGIDNMGDWRPNLGTAGSYEVYVFIPSNYATTTCARYEIYHLDGRTDVQVNQLNYSDEWVSLGTYRFAAGSSALLRLIDVTSEGYITKKIGFDSAKWEKRNRTPNPPTSVTISPVTPRTADVLIATATGGSDPDADPFWYKYQYSVDGGGWVDGQQVEASATTRGQQWKWRACTTDGAVDSGWVESGTVPIANSAPSVPTSVTISPSNPTLNQPLTASADGSTDADGDTITYEFTWSKDSGSTWSNPGGTLPASVVRANETWQVRSRASDGIEASEWVESASVTVSGLTGLLRSHVPLRGATNVPRQTPVTLAFNYAMKPLVTQQHFSMKDAAQKTVAGDFLWISPKWRVQFIPRRPLLPQTLYTVTLTAGPLRQDGKLTKQATFSFKTGAGPVVIATAPSGNKVNYRPYITCTFDRAMDHASVEDSFSIIPDVAGTASWDGNTFRFWPNTPLKAGTVYQMVMGKNAKAATGVRLGRKYAWWFRTAAWRGAALVLTAGAPMRCGDGLSLPVTLSTTALVTVEVLNLAGRPIAKLPARELPAGISTLTWNGRSNLGTAAPAGNYLCRVNANASDGSRATVLARFVLRP